MLTIRRNEFKKVKVKNIQVGSLFYHSNFGLCLKLRKGICRLEANEYSDGTIVFDVDPVAHNPLEWWVE